VNETGANKVKARSVIGLGITFGFSLTWLGLVTTTALAQTTTPQISDPQTPIPLTEPATEPQLDTTEEPQATPLMETIPGVEDLSDITPDHWAYKYVKSLNDRYNLLTGYPDSTFRGDQPLSRHEFVAVLAKVFERAELFKEERQEDLNALRRLAEFYREALAELRIRMDGLEERGSSLERQNVSATTKLKTQVIQTLTDGTLANTTAMSRLRLNLESSFTGQDLLVTQLEFGTNGSDAIALAQNRLGNRLSTTGLVDGGGLQESGTPSRGRLRKLYYQFPVGESLNVAIGTALPPSDFIDRNRFADSSGRNFASSFFANNPLIVQNEIDRFGGAGAAVSWKVAKKLTLRGLYAAADGNQTLEDRAQGTIEAEYQPAKNLTTKLQFTNAQINGTDINAFGVNLEWGVARELALFARYGVGSYEGLNTQLFQDFDLNPQSWMVGATLRNFLITGSTAGIAIGQPFVESGFGNATQTNVEGYFSFLLNDQINVVPSLQIVTNPDNQRSRTIWQWAFRMVIDF
jgi:hypothetical protein